MSNPAAAGTKPMVMVRNITKQYGRTLALRGATLAIERGEILSLVGHNGAGKSTLVRLISGGESSDSGDLTVGGEATGASYAGREAERRGVRLAYQELSLCPDLTVGENAYLSDRSRLPFFSWRRAARARMAGVLDEIFPQNRIRLESRIGELSLAERQMVEIARALCTSDVQLLILDEPTESLDADSAAALYRYLHRFVETGRSVLLISHRLREVLEHSDRISVLRDGQVVDTVIAGATDESYLMRAMGGELHAERAAPEADAVRSVPASAPVGSREVVASLAAAGAADGIRVHRGEIVGFAGLAGQGQEERLNALWKPGALSRGTRIPSRRAYVPGDRQSSGILPLWSVGENLSIGSLTQLSRYGFINAARRRALAADWVQRLAVRGGVDEPISNLSGGNQQKVLVARAFASDSELVLLDDPFRGVDVHTKNELYALMKDEAAAGRSIVWYSTENQEMAHCDRVYIFRAGRVVAELSGHEATEERIIAESFEDSKLSPALGMEATA